MSKRNEFRVNDLIRLMQYILGHRPDEFGLLPDPDGFVTRRELLRVLHEEPGFGYVREGDINEILLGKGREFFQTEQTRIRAVDRRWDMDLERPAAGLPRTLFIAVSRKAHPHVMKEGLFSSSDRPLVLSSDRDTALRIGRRRDQKPVLIVVSASDAADHRGVDFYLFGEIFLSRRIPVEFISGPPAPETREKAAEEPPDRGEEIRRAFGAGTFFLDPNRGSDPLPRGKGKKPRGWKEASRRIRKRKGG